MATRNPTAIRPIHFPYPLPEVNPSWLTSTVVGITSTILERKAGWDSLPILADALQDAGCDDEVILCHLRGQYRNQCKYCRRPGEKNIPTRIPAGECLLCAKTGYVAVPAPHDRPIHELGFFPDRNGGCWEGTCWVVQLLSGNAQRVAAEYHNGNKIVRVPVINPGAHDGDTWLVSPNLWPDGPAYAVEAATPTEAEEAFVDDVDFGSVARILPEEMGDYVERNEDGRIEHTCQFTGAGTPYDSDTLHVDGVEARHPPVPCRYKGPGIPLSGVSSSVYAEAGACDKCGIFCYPVCGSRVAESGGRFCSAECYMAHIKRRKKRKG